MGIEAVLGAVGNKALDFVDTAVQYYNQKHLNSQAQSDTQENMELAHRLNLQSVADSYVQSVAGMRRAGINPSRAVNGVNNAVGVSSSAGSAGSAAMPKNSVAETLSAVNQLEKQDSEIHNLDANSDLAAAEAEKARADAEGQKIKNARNKTEDSLVGQSLPILLAELKDNTDSPFIVGFIEEFENYLTSDDINLGVLDSFGKMFFDFTQRERDRELDYISKEMDKYVLTLQYENGAAEALADIPKATRLQIYRNIALMNAQIGQLNAETSLTEDKRNAIRASISKLGQEVQSLLHHDPAAMWHAGDISGLLVMLGYDGVKAASTGAGFAVGARTAGAGVPKPIYSPKKLPTKLKLPSFDESIKLHGTRADYREAISEALKRAK